MRHRALPLACAILIAAIAAPLASAYGPAQAPVGATYSRLLAALDRRAVVSARVDESADVATVTYRDGRSVAVRYPTADKTLPLRMVRDGVDVTIVKGSSASAWLSLLLLAGLPLALFSGVVIRNRRRNRSGAPAGARDRNVGSLRGDVSVATTPRTRFSDVAGCDETVEELAEIVEFLRRPERFRRVDARMPSGLLLTGPPGTGKTLLARALAGEANVNFFAVSGSEFVEKYVGVGASRVRELFKRAIAAAPSVIFIDELDAIGTSRNDQESNSERAQTLNELLVQMDGFTTTSQVVVVAATNRPEILDAALLRPGRFSRTVSVGLPSEEGRRAILGVHSAGKPLLPAVDLDAIAAATGGFSGAQLAELLNEAAIMAARDDRATIGPDDLREGLRRVLGGPKRRSAPIADGELEKIAYHEAGHVICAELCEHHEKAQHVTIDPRGNAMGFALFAQHDRALHDEDHLREAMIAALGGRAAEQLVFGRVSSGAKNDLEKVSAIARAAVTEFGMSERIGQFVGDGRLLSDRTKALIEHEVERHVAGAYKQALALLQSHRAKLDALASRLLDLRELERVDIVATLSG